VVGQGSFQPKSKVYYYSSTARMATTAGLEQDLKKLSLVENSYPQAKDADNDPVKLSSAIFPKVEVSGHATGIAETLEGD
jgi:hypothetical protein